MKRTTKGTFQECNKNNQKFSMGKKLLGFSEEKNKALFETMLHEQADSAAQEIQKSREYFRSTAPFGIGTQSFNHHQSAFTHRAISPQNGRYGTWRFPKLLKQQLDEIPLLNFFFSFSQNSLFNTPKERENY